MRACLSVIRGLCAAAEAEKTENRLKPQMNTDFIARRSPNQRGTARAAACNLSVPTEMAIEPGPSLALRACVWINFQRAYRRQGVPGARPFSRRPCLKKGAGGSASRSEL